MEVVGALAAQVNSLPDQDKHEHANTVRLGRGQSVPIITVISSLASLLDWLSDFAYADSVREWSSTGYAPTESERFRCMAHTVHHGSFVQQLVGARTAGGVQ